MGTSAPSAADDAVVDGVVRRVVDVEQEAVEVRPRGDRVLVKLRQGDCREVCRLGRVETDYGLVLFHFFPIPHDAAMRRRRRHRTVAVVAIDGRGVKGG